MEIAGTSRNVGGRMKRDGSSQPHNSDRTIVEN